MSSRNLIVAFGGVSPEHEVSVLTAMQVIESLKGTNYNIIPLYISKSGRWLTQVLRRLRRSLLPSIPVQRNMATP